MEFYVSYLEISCKFRRGMIVSSLKTQRSLFSNLQGCILLMSSMKGGWPSLRRDLGTYLKIRRVVTPLKSDIDLCEDFSFSFIRHSNGYENFPITVGSHYLTLFLSLVFPVEGIIVERTSYIISSFM